MAPWARVDEGSGRSGHAGRSARVFRGDVISSRDGDFPTPAADPLSEALSKERLRMVDRVMEELSETMCRDVELRVVHHLSHREIGRILGITTETAKSYQYRARKRLKTRLTGGCGWVEPEENECEPSGECI